MLNLASNTIELETQMDEDLHLQILSLLKYIRQVSPHCVECSLKKSTSSNDWAIEFVWHDAASMHNHFSSESLQALLKLLVTRCSRLYFELVSTTVA